MQFCELNAIYEHICIRMKNLGMTEAFGLPQKMIYTQLYNFFRILINDA